MLRNEYAAAPVDDVSAVDPEAAQAEATSAASTMTTPRRMSAFEQEPPQVVLLARLEDREHLVAGLELR